MVDQPHTEQWDPNDPRTQERYERAKAKAKAKSNGHRAPNPIKWIDLTAPIKERAWYIDSYIPDNNVALVSGEGEAGKSILTQQLCAVTALNAISGHDHDWLGLLPKGGKAMYVTCEEDDGECRRRLEQSAKHYGTTRADLEQAMQITSWIDYDSTQLMAVDKRSDTMTATDLYHHLAHEVAAYKPRVIALDTAADLFGGSEINRNHTRTFISYIRRLALTAQNDCAAILLTHPSLEGIRSGTGLSGSTAWHNSVRSRCVFKKFKDEDDEDGGEPDPDLRLLEWRKNNYGPAQSSITVRYKAGVYVVEGSGGSLEQQLRDRNTEALFLKLLRARVVQDRPVSDRGGKNYAPTVFAKEPEARTAKIGAAAFEAAMNRLFAAGRIEVRSDGPRWRPGRCIVEKVSGTET